MPAIAVVLARTSGGALAAEQATRLLIEDMACPSCPVIAKLVLQRVDGVTAASIADRRKIATVTYDDTRISVAAGEGAARRGDWRKS